MNDKCMFGHQWTVHTVGSPGATWLCLHCNRSLHVKPFANIGIVYPSEIIRRPDMPKIGMMRIDRSWGDDLRLLFNGGRDE